MLRQRGQHVYVSPNVSELVKGFHIMAAILSQWSTASRQLRKHSTNQLKDS